MVLELGEPFASLWQGRDAFAEVDRLEGETYRALEGRRTFRTLVNGEGFFVKVHKGVGWGEILKNLASLRMPVIGAGNEWQALTRLGAQGVTVPVPVAFGVRGSNPARQESFIITRELTPVIDLDVLTHQWLAQPVSAAVRRRLIHRVASMTRDMHAAGINHRDCYLCHFLLVGDVATAMEDGFAGTHLIDLHRARYRQSLPTRWRIKDISGLYFSSLHMKLSRTDIFRFLRVYYARPLREVLATAGPELARIERKAQRTLRHHLKHHAGNAP